MQSITFESKKTELQLNLPLFHTALQDLQESMFKPPECITADDCQSFGPQNIVLWTRTGFMSFKGLEREKE